MTRTLPISMRRAGPNTTSIHLALTCLDGTRETVPHRLDYREEHSTAKVNRAGRRSLRCLAKRLRLAMPDYLADKVSDPRLTVPGRALMTSAAPISASQTAHCLPGAVPGPRPVPR